MGVRIVLLGPPGSGKGTQAAFLARHFGVPAISTGEMLRGAVSAGSELGQRVKNTLNAGQLVDDATMADLVRDRLSRSDAESGFLLDGYPRTLPQADTLSAILAGGNVALDRVLLIEVPEPVLLARALARKREDDTEDVIRERIRVYARQTEPLVEYYRNRDLLAEIDGNQAVAAVTTALTAALQSGLES